MKAECFTSTLTGRCNTFTLTATSFEDERCLTAIMQKLGQPSVLALSVIHENKPSVEYQIKLEPKPND